MLGNRKARLSQVVDSPQDLQTTSQGRSRPSTGTRYGTAPQSHVLRNLISRVNQVKSYHPHLSPLSIRLSTTSIPYLRSSTGSSICEGSNPLPPHSRRVFSGFTSCTNDLQDIWSAAIRSFRISIDSRQSRNACLRAETSACGQQ